MECDVFQCWWVASLHAYVYGSSCLTLVLGFVVCTNPSSQCALTLALTGYRGR